MATLLKMSPLNVDSDFLVTGFASEGKSDRKGFDGRSAVEGKTGHEETSRLVLFFLTFW